MSMGFFWKPNEESHSRRKEPDLMLLRNQVRCGLRVDPWIRQDTVKVTLKKCFLGKC